jgi:glycerophosphoryl diester phosphodiesterase
MKSALDQWPYPRHVAHRGAGKLAPENTLAAIRHGASLGYRMFEIDAKLSGDGVLLLMHDATLERTSNGRGRVAGQDWRALSQLDAGSWHSAAFAGEGIPTLARVAAWLRANGCLVNVEIKPCPGREEETGAAVALEVRSLWKGAAVMPLLSSFSEDALAAARRAAPELPRALLTGDLPTDWVERCEVLGCVALDAHHATLSEDIVRQAHQRGLRVACYTLNDPARAKVLLDWGVDCVITDALDLIAPDRD